MQRYSNVNNITLGLAVWLAHDSYDHQPDPNYISATGLLKPVKVLVLSARVAQQDDIEDISGLTASRIGTALHDAIERVWETKHDVALQNLGYPQPTIDRILVNPSEEELMKAGPDAIPVYMEQRRTKEIAGYKIGGKFDFLAAGELEDFKSTSVFGYLKGSNDDDYIKQASIYRWLNQDRVTSEQFKINYIFKDWLRSKTKQDPKYPPTQVLSKSFPLMSVADTEDFIQTKLGLVSYYMDLPEDKMPACTDEELWRTATVWKYFKNPQKLSRSTKNFTTELEANTRLLEDGQVGAIQEVKGEVKRCNYCPAFSVCKQKDVYLADGTLQPL